MALEAVQAQAGHRSIESTRVYLASDWLAGEYRRAAANRLAAGSRRVDAGVRAGLGIGRVLHDIVVAEDEVGRPGQREGAQAFLAGAGRSRPRSHELSGRRCRVPRSAPECRRERSGSAPATSSIAGTGRPGQTRSGPHVRGRRVRPGCPSLTSQTNRPLASGRPWPLDQGGCDAMPRRARAIPTAGAAGSPGGRTAPGFGPGSTAPGGVHHRDGPVYLLGVPAEEPAQVFQQGGSARDSTKSC